MPDFNALLKVPADSIKKPPVLPAGTYLGNIAPGSAGKAYEFGESKEKKTPYVMYHFSVTEAGQDVDPSMLSVDGVAIDLSKKHFRQSFYLTPEAMYRLKDFIASCGVATSGRTLAEIIPEVVGAKVIMSITQKTSDDGQEIFNILATVKGA